MKHTFELDFQTVHLASSCPHTIRSWIHQEFCTTKWKAETYKNHFTKKVSKVSEWNRKKCSITRDSFGVPKVHCKYTEKIAKVTLTMKWCILMDQMFWMMCQWNNYIPQRKCFWGWQSTFRFPPKATAPQHPLIHCPWRLSWLRRGRRIETMLRWSIFSDQKTIHTPCEDTVLQTGRLERWREVESNGDDKGGEDWDCGIFSRKVATSLPAPLPTHSVPFE